MPAELDACVEKVMNEGHSESEAFAICNDSLYGSSSNNSSRNKEKAMSQEIAAFPPKEDKPEGEGKGVSFSEGEVGKITQGLTDAQDFIAQSDAPEELKKSVAEAFETVYAKVNVAPAEDAPKQENPFA